jgi:hypothetical protein
MEVTGACWKSLPLRTGSTCEWSRQRLHQQLSSERLRAHCDGRVAVLLSQQIGYPAPASAVVSCSCQMTGCAGGALLDYHNCCCHTAGVLLAALHLLLASEVLFVCLYLLPSVHCHHWQVLLLQPCLVDSAAAAAAAGAPCVAAVCCAAAHGAAGVCCWGSGVLCT